MFITSQFDMPIPRRSVTASDLISGQVLPVIISYHIHEC